MVDLVFGDKDRVDTVALMGGRAVGVAVSVLSVLWELPGWVMGGTLGDRIQRHSDATLKPTPGPAQSVPGH